MDVARLNFSHGSHAQHAQTLSMLRTASLKVRKAVGVLGDLQGPKIRTGKLAEGKVELVPGAEFSITTDESVLGTQELVSTTYPFLASDVNPGDRILLDDGLLELRVLETDKKSAGANRGGARRHAEEQQGHQPARRRAAGRGAHPEGPRGPGLRHQGGGGLHRAVLRSSAGRPRPGACGDGRGGPPGADHLQAGEARGHRPAGRDPREVRRGDGGPRRPRGGAAARGGPGDPEGHHPPGKPAWTPGHRRHADAELDDASTRGRPAPRPRTWRTRSTTARTR